jgi:hypothetical protein
MALDCELSPFLRLSETHSSLVPADELIGRDFVLAKKKPVFRRSLDALGKIKESRYADLHTTSDFADCSAVLLDGTELFGATRIGEVGPPCRQAGEGG